jgi:hypothetical protein
MEDKKGLNNAILSPAQTGPTDDSPKRRRGDDSGEDLLPTMEHFVTLTRRVKQPLRLLEMAQRFCCADVPQELIDTARASKAALIPTQRRKLYEWIAVVPPELLAKLEHASDRIDSLKDEFGIQSVLSLLDPQSEADALALVQPTDKFTRALYLFLAQEFPAVGLLPDQRFDQAESQQAINQQWSSMEYASHFLGPKEAIPRPNEEMFEQLRINIAGLFGGVDPQDILLHHFKHVDRSHASRHESEPEQNKFHKLQHTITATFNGTMAFYKQVNNKEVVEMEEPAAVEFVFSWEPETGMLGVFCPDKTIRAQLASIFQSTVLGSSEAISNVPMCTFELKEFATSSIINKIEGALVVGVSAVAIQKIRLTNVTRLANPLPIRGRENRRQLTSQMEISRDRRDSRDLYTVASDAYQFKALSGDDISRVNLSLSVAKALNRKAHNISVQITRPNGLSSRCKTAQDRELVRLQLISLGVMKEVALA